MGHSAPYTYNLSLSEVCENKHCFLTLAATLCADSASSVLVQVHFPGALRNRLKAEKTLVIAAAEIRSIVWVWAYCWCSPGLVLLDEDGQGGQEGCAKNQQYKLNSLWSGTLKVLSGAQEMLKSFYTIEQSLSAGVCESPPQCFLLISLHCGWSS